MDRAIPMICAVRPNFMKSTPSHSKTSWGRSTFHLYDYLHTTGFFTLGRYRPFSFDLLNEKHNYSFFYSIIHLSLFYKDYLQCLNLLLQNLMNEQQCS